MALIKLAVILTIIFGAVLCGLEYVGDRLHGIR
jgi:hypothetical protein